MKRLALPLLLLIAGCTGGAAPRYGQQQGAQDDTIATACRQDAERMMRYRERGQIMRVDEAESRSGTGAFIGGPLERQQLGARFEQDRLVSECIRGAQRVPGATAPVVIEPAVTAPPATTAPAAGTPRRSGSGRGS